jgi:diguanylate cyclase (GGDEF)-like protein/PAS domain S-box-containing protein
VRVPARSRPRSKRDRRPGASSASGRRHPFDLPDLTFRSTFLLGILLGTVATAPAGAAPLGDNGQSVSMAIVAAGAALAFVILVAISMALSALLRRTRIAAKEARRLTSLLDVLDEGVAVCSGMQAVAVNTSLCRLIGIEPAEAQHLMISSFIGDSDVIDRLLGEEELRVETDITNRAGESIAVEIAARTISYGEGSARLLEIRDVGERKTTQQRVSFLAHHDALTQLPNRELMRARLSEATERAAANGTFCAVLWIDLDHFKDINDVHGHMMGDQILRIVAEKLKFEMPADTMISRLGGDEFVVLCENINDALEARLIGQQLRRLLNRPIDLGEKQLTVGASIGVAVFPDDATSAEDLLKNADLALFHAKTEGRGRCRHFTDELGKERQRRMVLSEQLRAAIEHGEIQAYFQPLVRVRDMRVVGFETLGRWFHPEFGPIPPPEFVKLAEENGLITPLTDLIMRKAIDAARLWPNDVRVSVNISPVQINSELVDQVRDIIKQSGLDPKRLELEVTEDVLIKDFEQTASMFARLRALGVQVAMDDFGAGYTSMGNLRRLNFDRLKIDRIFTMDLPNHRRSAAIVRSMFVLARELDLEVTVEGVETYEQYAFLRGAGNCELQGYLFSPPKAASAFADPAALQFATPVPRAAEPAAPNGSAIPINTRQARRAS